MSIDWGQLGLWGILLVAIIQSLGLPFPSWIVLTPAAVMISQHKFTLTELCIVYVIGQTLGDYLAYGGTIRFSERITRVFPTLYRRIDHPVIKKLFAQSPAKALIGAYFLSYFRPVVNYLSPVLGIPFPVFALWSLVRNALFVPLYILGFEKTAQVIIEQPEYRPYVITVGVLIAAYMWWKHKNEPKPDDEQPSEPQSDDTQQPTHP